MASPLAFLLKLHPCLVLSSLLLLLCPLALLLTPLLLLLPLPLLLLLLALLGCCLVCCCRGLGPQLLPVLS